MPMMTLDGALDAVSMMMLGRPSYMLPASTASGMFKQHKHKAFVIRSPWHCIIRD